MRTKEIILAYLTLLALINVQVNAQNENANWLIGYKRGAQALDIIYQVTINDTGIVEQKAIPFNGACLTSGNSATYSDPETGELLLFSNGMTIYNKDMEIIENGNELYLTELGMKRKNNKSGIVGPFHTYFIPDPGNKNRIYFFNSPVIGFEPIISLKLYYSIIKKDSLGKFHLLNPENPIFYTQSQNHYMPMFIRHANGRDWWIICFGLSGDINFYILDPTGVHFSHLQQVEVGTISDYIGYGLGNFQHNSSTLSYFVFDASSDNETYPENLVIMKFNRCTGEFYEIINKPIHKDSMPILEYSNATALLDFHATSTSPNGRYLFTASEFDIYQFDLSHPNWYKTRKNIYSVPDSLRGQSSYGFGIVSMVYGQDGRLYVTHGTSDRWISVINKPYRRGKAVDFKFKAISLPENMLYYCTTPSTVDFNMGPVDGSPCDTLGLDNEVKALFRHDIVDVKKGKVDFCDLSEYHPTSWTWDFDDGTESQEQYPIHTYTEEGIYHVCLTASNINGSDTYCEDVVIDGLTATISIAELQMKIYPNPTSDDVLHLLNPENVRGKYAISDIQGKVIKIGELIGSKKQSISLSGLSPAVYVLSIKSKAGVYSEKIVVQ